MKNATQTPLLEDISSLMHLPGNQSNSVNPKVTVHETQTGSAR